MSVQWENWSGSIIFKAHKLIRPKSEEEVMDIIRDASLKGRTLRVKGSSHSSMPLFVTDDTLISLERMRGVISHDTQTSTADCLPGTTIKTLGDELLLRHLSPPNLGDVALQHIAGAIGTGTHGTGVGLGNLSTMLIGGKLINGNGELITIEETDTHLLNACRVSLGLLGIFTEMKLSLQPLYKLERKEWFVPFLKFIDHIEELINQNRHMDFYWYPRNDLVKIRTMNHPGQGVMNVSEALLDEEKIDYAQNILHKHTEIKNKFEEMEYELPFEEGVKCFLKVRDRVLKKWRKLVGWRLLYRTIKEDDSYLSPAFGRKTVSISLHQNSSLPYKEFFQDIEPIFRDHQGRPHWAKKHNLTKKELRSLYPKWDHFVELREKFDPKGVFLNSYLKETFT